MILLKYRVMLFTVGAKVKVDRKLKPYIELILKRQAKK